MTQEEVLNECFRTAGSRHGFDSVTAEFEEFSDLKVRWQRSYRWAEFKVSDYLTDAPAAVLRDLAESIFSKIADCNRGYPESVKEWMLRPGFVLKNRPTYLQRYAYKTHREGRHRSLNASLQRLYDKGLVPPDSDIAVLWTEDRFLDSLACSSVLMKTVFVSETADSEDVPEDVLDYVVYSEICRIISGFDPEGKNPRGAEAMKDRYPARWEKEKWVRDFLNPLDESDDIIWRDDSETEGCLRKKRLSPGR